MTRYIQTGDEQRAEAKRDAQYRFEAWLAEALAIAGRAGLDIETDDWEDAYLNGLEPDEAAAALVGDE